MVLVGQLLLLVGQMVLVLALPWWLWRSSYGRCLDNWLHYRHWTPCPHPGTVFRLSPVVSVQGAALWESACLVCGTVFIRDTRANWEAELTRVPGRTRGAQTLRHWLTGIALLALLSGCADTVYWWSRTSMGLDCRPEVIKQHQGQCVSVAKGK